MTVIKREPVEKHVSLRGNKNAHSGHILGQERTKYDANGDRNE